MTPSDRRCLVDSLLLPIRHPFGKERSQAEESVIVFLGPGDFNLRAGEADVATPLLRLDDKCDFLHLEKCGSELVEKAGALTYRKRHQVGLFVKVSAADLFFAVGKACLNMRIATGAAERLAATCCAVAHIDGGAHTSPYAHGWSSSSMGCGRTVDGLRRGLSGTGLCRMLCH
jgi:hypothetical protein